MSETGQLDPEAIDHAAAGNHALFRLNQLGFKLDSSTGFHRLLRTTDGSQAHLYSVEDPKNSRQGILGDIGSVPRDIAAVLALELAEAILNDQAERLKLPRWTPPSVDSTPYN
jgi:hypothetical protein